MLHIRDDPIFLHNVIAGIEKLCLAKKYKVSHTAVDLVVRSNLMRPDNILTFQETTRKDELMYLCNVCLEQLTRGDQMYQKLLSVQACYHSLSGGCKKIVLEYHQKIDETLKPLVEAITSFQLNSTKDVLEFTDRIAKYTVLVTFLGSPNDLHNLRCTKNILKTLIDEKFMELMEDASRDEKKNILDAISTFVGGIRLFNIAKGESDEKLEDYPRILKSYLENIKKELTVKLRECMVLRDNLNVIMTGFLKWKIWEDRISTEIETPNDISQEEFNYGFYMLLIYNQVITYLNIIYKNVNGLQSRYQKNLKSYFELVKKICQASNIYMSTSILRPLFVDLYSIYRFFFDAIIILENFSRTTNYLMNFLMFNDMPNGLNELLFMGNETMKQQLSENDLDETIMPVKDMYSQLVKMHLNEHEMQPGTLKFKGCKDITFKLKEEIDEEMEADMEHEVTTPKHTKILLIIFILLIVYEVAMRKFVNGQQKPEVGETHVISKTDIKDEKETQRNVELNVYTAVEQQIGHSSKSSMDEENEKIQENVIIVQFMEVTDNPEQQSTDVSEMNTGENERTDDENEKRTEQSNDTANENASKVDVDASEQFREMNTEENTEMSFSIFPDEMTTIDRYGTEEFKTTSNEDSRVDAGNLLDEILMKNIDKSLIMFQGFDPVTLVEGNGLLLKVNPEIGCYPVLEYFVGFSKTEAAVLFIKNPSNYFCKIVDYIRMNPMYIEILQLGKMMRSLIGRGWLSEHERTFDNFLNVGTQTETHFQERNIDPSYVHSRWAMNAPVLKMATIQRRRTKSCQNSRLQYSTLDQAVQMSSWREKSSQTKKDSSCNTAKPHVYRYGLRFGPECRNVSLTMPLEEPHQRILMPSIRTRTSTTIQTEDLEIPEESLGPDLMYFQDISSGSLLYPPKSKL